MLAEIATPALLLDEGKMMRNIARIRDRLNGLGIAFRPHLKTAKSVDVARRLVTTPRGPAAVSSLKEAEEFAAVGIRDLLYTVGIAPAKFPRVIELRKRGLDLSVVVDSPEQAQAVALTSRNSKETIPAFIEIDADGHRSGLNPEDPSLIAIARALEEGGELRGVMVHAGDSYNHPGAEALAWAAEQERKAAVLAAERLRRHEFSCPIVSVGSTPTACFARDLTGVTEVRAGVFVFFDLVMAGLGVCGVGDIALSVLATVIGHQKAKGWILVDAGWMAMSRDRGTARQLVDQGYGLVCDIRGIPYPDLIMAAANQEHGILAIRQNSVEQLPDLKVGSMVRILPNHACATGAQHHWYYVLGPNGENLGKWARFSGW